MFYLFPNFIFEVKDFFFNTTYFNDIYTYKIHLMDHTYFNTLNTCFHYVKEAY